MPGPARYRDRYTALYPFARQRGPRGIAPSGKKAPSPSGVAVPFFTRQDGCA